MASMEVDEEALRIGLELYQRTTLHGPHFYSLYDLAFSDEKQNQRSIFKRLFSSEESFWGRQKEIGRYLENAGLAQLQRSQVAGSAHSDYSVRLTALGKSIFSLAYIQTDHRVREIEGLAIEDLSLLLRDEDRSMVLAKELRELDFASPDLALSNYERTMVLSYNSMLAIVCEMPERDPRLFWTILERLNNFAGVASLVVALIAMKMSQ